MTLAEARKLAIRKQVRIQFAVREGLEATINEHGVAEVPNFRAVADFNLEESFQAASGFRLESAGDPKARPRMLSAAELQKQISSLGSGPDNSDHEE